MLRLETEKIDPRTMDVNVVKNHLLSFKETGNNKLVVEWFDLSLTQEEALSVYLPLIHYAQTLGLSVYCVMSQRMCENLVRYKQLMFVDTLFLLKFKFKEIRFTLPYNRPDLMR